MGWLFDLQVGCLVCWVVVCLWAGCLFVGFVCL